MTTINREVLKSSERIRRKRAVAVISYLALILAALFAITSLISHQDRLYIKTIYVSGNETVEDEQIFKVVQSVLEGRYYGIYPRNNILIYPKEEIASAVVARIPWIASATVSGGMNMVSVQVKEREPRYLWCEDLSLSSVERSCYYLDGDGYSFGLAPCFSSHIYLELYGGDKKGGYIGRQIISREEFRSLLEAVGGMSKLLLDNKTAPEHIYGIYIHGNGDYDAYVAGGKKDWKIMFNLGVDSAKKLKVVMSSPFFTRELRDSSRQLEYVDLRFGKKVFYKFNAKN